MNERIRKIAIETDAWCDQHYTGDPMYDIKWEQKFAELIVRECVDIVSKVPNGYRDYRNQIEDAMRGDCLQAIQEHFGVEN
jgi:hypothetical protein